MKKVSIIVPVYNAAEYVGKCLESIALQDYKNIEIIVVEDGSDDESPEVCQEYACQYANIKYIIINVALQELHEITE
mgnify:CR=1 FL=1